MNQAARGKKYEKAAVEYLKRRGYAIVATNFRYQRTEIDVICSINHDLVFVEVKGGKSRDFGDPIYRIDERKRRSIIETAQGYIQQSLMAYDSYRFDVLIVSEKGGKLTFDHRKGAFTV